jgi:DNA polymerase-1
LPNYDREIVFHNWKFDVLMLEYNGVQVPRRLLHDSEVLCHLENAGYPKAMKSSASRYIDRNFTVGQQKLEQAMSTEGWDWATVPLDYGPYWHYAALDPIMAARLAEKFWHHRTLPIYDIEIRSTDVYLRAEQRGYRIDVDYCEKMSQQLREYGQQLRRWGKETYDVDNLTSDMQVAAILERDGWVPTVFTEKTGRPSLVKEVAQWIDHPLAKAMLECKHAEKMAGTYLENFLEYSFDGRVHANIKTLGARTGRTQVSEPALQTLPRDDAVARDAFVPSTGSKLVICDYDQIEARLMVHFAHAESMVPLFFDPTCDFFTGMARQMYGDPTLVKADVRRDYAKRGTYAKIYGAGVEKFSASVGLTDADGQLFLNMLDATYPEIVELQNEVSRVGREREASEGAGYVVSPLGRRHPLVRHEGVYKLLNYLIQGTAADVLKQKVVELDAAGIADYLVLPVHDELDFDVPEPLLPEVLATIREVMPSNDFSVPITVGIDVVDRWGEKYR